MDPFVCILDYFRQVSVHHPIFRLALDSVENYIISILFNYAKFIASSQFTLNRRLPIGGFAYGMLMNALIGRPVCDRMYFPINLLSFANVTRKSSEVTVKTSPIIAKHSEKIKTAREPILNRNG